MTNLLLKTETELFKWETKRQRHRDRDTETETERQRDRETERQRDRETERQRERRGLWSDSGGEFWEAAGIYIIPLFQFKVHRTNSEQHSSLLPEHVNMFIYIYEIGYCYEDRC